MKILRTGRQIGQAVKNVGRLRQILAVFAKHGFADVVDRMNLGPYLPSRLAAYAESQGEFTIPERLRKAFEELGPTFVKLGQLLSTRSDLLPTVFLDEFKKLQDNVQPLPYEVAKAAVEKELGKTLDEAYASFTVTPVGAASIGQVHLAELKTGEKVVVKVQRPEIQKLIDQDVALLAFLANLLEKYIPELRVIGPKIIVDEFFKTLAYELDYRVEANNMTRIAENMRSIPEVVIPKVYRELSTTRVLTLERLEGIRVNDIAALDQAGIDRKRVVAIGARSFFKSIMIDGLFHGDLHGGNLFVLPGDRLGVIDFGIVGRLSEKSRDQLASMVMSLLSDDYENLCYQYAELGQASPSMDFDGFVREVRNTLSPYMGLSLKELNVGKILIDATQIATRYNIKVPGDWMIVFKAILTIEGMGRELDPEFDLLNSGRDIMSDLVKNQYSWQRLSRDLVWVSKDVSALLQVLPRQIRWMFKKFTSNDFAFEVRLPQLDLIQKQLDRNGRKMSSSVLASGAFIASALALQKSDGYFIWDYPLPAVILFTFGSLLSLQILLRRR